MDTLIWKMTQYTRLLCLLVCFAVQDLSLAEIGEWDDSGLSGSNMGLRILKRENGQIGRFIKMDSHPTMNMVNEKKKNLIYVQYLCTFRMIFFFLLVMVKGSTDLKMKTNLNISFSDRVA